MKRAPAALLIAVLTAPALLASGPGSMPSPATRMSPHDEAVESYNSAERRLDKLAKTFDDMKAATDPQAQAKLQQKITKGLESAAGELRRAITNEPKMFQAYSELGFTLRKLGKYPESLEAYDKALQLQPNFSPAIEYRAEAYLGLNRTEEAREAYTMLFVGDRPRADALLVAMKSYVAARKSDPAGVDAAKLADFGTWVEQRETIHSQTAPLTQQVSALRAW
jgi:tetratricopeptide (TPR) repeat protein